MASPVPTGFLGNLKHVSTPRELHQFLVAKGIWLNEEATVAAFSAIRAAAEEVDDESLDAVVGGTGASVPPSFADDGRIDFETVSAWIASLN